jgi:hypothetical protein
VKAWQVFGAVNQAARLATSKRIAMQHNQNLVGQWAQGFFGSRAPPRGSCGPPLRAFAREGS